MEKELSIREAIDAIVNHPQETKASPEIQQAINNRINPYPAKIGDNIHRALIKVPLELAAVLKLQPDLISPIVNAYCNHDVIDAKCLRDVKLENDAVCIKVNFTKHLYAMLAYSTLMSTGTIEILRLKKDKRLALGFKLFCGYKIVMNDGLDIWSTKDYKRFIQNLTENGYFKQNLEGSKDHKLLLKKANEYYSLLLSPTNKNVCSRIQNVIASEEFKKTAHSLRNCDESSFIEDSEEWLDIHPQQLNDLLISRYGQHTKFKNDVTPQGMTNQVSSFLNQISDFEGIELNNRGNNINNDVIEFDADVFSESLKEILNLISPDNDADTDGFTSDEYGEDDANIQLDRELKETLLSDIIKQTATENKKSTYDIFVQGVREEGQSGPTSNLLKSIIAINKQDNVLDSDDDDDDE